MYTLHTVDVSRIHWESFHDIKPQKKNNQEV